MLFTRVLFFKLFLICVFLISSFQIYALSYAFEISDEDIIVKMHGYIYDTINDHPNKIPVKAKIIFESQPHASEIGIITSNDSSGYYEYYINLKHKYRIDIRSEHHRWYVEMFDPNEIVVDGEIARNFYLEPQLKENQVMRLNKLIFDRGLSTITEESYAELNRLVNLMLTNIGMQIQLEGHTDYRGGKRQNMQLSQNRVAAVKDYLVSKGIQSKRIKTKAYGGSRPLIKESSIEASEINRRVEVRIIKLN